MSSRSHRVILQILILQSRAFESAAAALTQQLVILFNTVQELCRGLLKVFKNIILFLLKSPI
jgi:hypothetical protein